MKEGDYFEGLYCVCTM